MGMHCVERGKKWDEIAKSGVTRRATEFPTSRKYTAEPGWPEHEEACEGIYLKDLAIAAGTDRILDRDHMQKCNPGRMLDKASGNTAGFGNIHQGVTAIFLELDHLRGNQKMSERQLIEAYCLTHKLDPSPIIEWAEDYGERLTDEIDNSEQFRSWLEWHEYEGAVCAIIGGVNNGAQPDDAMLQAATKACFATTSPW